MVDESRISGVPWATTAISLLLISMFVLQRITTPPDCLGANYPALCTAASFIGDNVSTGFLIAPLLHGSWTHLFLNIGMIGLFGSTFELVRDRFEYFVFLFTSAYLSIDAQLLGAVIAGKPLPVVIGASGSGYALAGFVLAYALFVWRSSWFDNGVSRRDRVVFQAVVTFLSLLVVIDAIPVLRIPLPVSSAGRSATLTHAIGTGIGVVWGVVVGTARDI